MARAVGQVQTVPRRGRAGWAAGGLGTGGTEAAGVWRLFHAALAAKLQGHLVSEWALPTSQEAMAIKEVGWSVLIVISEYRSFFFFKIQHETG